MPSMFENKRLCMTDGMQKSNENVVMHLQVPQQNTTLLWQLNSQKHIGPIPELLRCRTIIVVNFNLVLYRFSDYEESLILYWMTLVLSWTSSNFCLAGPTTT